MSFVCLFSSSVLQSIQTIFYSISCLFCNSGDKVFFKIKFELEKQVYVYQVHVYICMCGHVCVWVCIYMCACWGAFWTLVQEIHFLHVNFSRYTFSCCLFFLLNNKNLTNKFWLVFLTSNLGSIDRQTGTRVLVFSSPGPESKKGRGRGFSITSSWPRSLSSLCVINITHYWSLLKKYFNLTWQKTYGQHSSPEQQ